MTPYVTVLMPVYNGAKYLALAIDSILSQTYRNFELLIINDCSKDNSADVIAAYSDPRIRVVTNEKNLGLVGTLNRGLGEAKGAFIARMDQDDLSAPERLQRQVEFLASHPDVGIVGTTACVLHPDGQITSVNGALTDNNELKLLLMLVTPFVHGSVMMRLDHIRRLAPPYYRSEGGIAEDYDFWSRMSAVTQFAVLPEVLYTWRDNPTGMSNSGEIAQSENARMIRERNHRTEHLLKLVQTYRPEIRKYANTMVQINDRSWPVRRLDTYSFLLWVLFLFCLRRGRLIPAWRYGSTALIGNFSYFTNAFLARLTRRHLPSSA